MSGKRANFILIILFFFAFLMNSRVQAALKDSDVDGLTDQSEAEVYHTDSSHPDTDGDGISDGDEVVAGSNPLTPELSPSKELETTVPENFSYAWFIGRASGILAFILLTIVVANGLLITTRLVFKLLPPALNYEMHRFFAWMALLSVIGHFASFLFDDFFHLTIVEGLVPFQLARPFHSVLGFDLRYAVGMGTLAFYGILALVISSELKGRGVSLKNWRILHYMSFGTYLLFLIHGITSGTDTKTWWMLWLYSISALIVLGLTGLRIYISVTKKSGPVTTPPSVSPPAPQSITPPTV